MFLSLKNNAATGYKGPIKIEVLKGAGLLNESTLHIQNNKSFVDHSLSYFHFSC